MLGATSIPAGAQSFGGDRRSTGEKAAIIAGSAAAGALLGGLLKGGKGALVGGLVGGGAGTAYVYIQGRRDTNRYGYYDRYGYYRNGRYYSNYGYYRDADGRYYRVGDDRYRYDRYREPCDRDYER
jgi:hypothetical protein